jgi:hypothetical protein
MFCGLLCWDICDVEDRFVLAESSLYTAGDGVDIGGLGGCFKCGYSVLRGGAVADLLVEISDLVCCVYHLSVNVMEYPV